MCPFRKVTNVHTESRGYFPSSADLIPKEANRFVVTLVWQLNISICQSTLILHIALCTSALSFPVSPSCSQVSVAQNLSMSAAISLLGNRLMNHATTVSCHGIE